MEEQPVLWREWGLLTRFMESARLAFARERSLWHSLELHNRSSVKINAPTGGQGRYKVPLDEHVRAIEDEETLFASVLIHSYALAESAARERLGCDARPAVGIEKWGMRLLQAADRTWEDVAGGEAGAVEVAVVRNAFAHGSRVIDAPAEQRLRRAGATHRIAGDPVLLTYDDVRLFRERLRSLLNAGGLRYRTPPGN